MNNPVATRGSPLKITKAELSDALTAVGVEKGECVYVASSIAALSGSPDPEGLALECLLDAVGPAGTLVMPTGSNAFREHGFFDRELTPSTSGALTERFRVHPGTCRTFAPPFNTVSAWGRRAQELCSIQSPTPFGAGSVYDHLVKINARVLLLGCSFHDGVAHMHWLEEEHGAHYREWTQHRGQIILAGTPNEYVFSHYTRKSGYRISYDPMEHELQRVGALSLATVGLLSLTSFLLEDFAQALWDWFPRNHQRLVLP